MNRSELTLKILEMVCGDIQELHIYENDLSQMVITQNNKKITITIRVEEENNGN